MSPDRGFVFVSLWPVVLWSRIMLYSSTEPQTAASETIIQLNQRLYKTVSIHYLLKLYIMTSIKVGFMAGLLSQPALDLARCSNYV